MKNYVKNYLKTFSISFLIGFIISSIIIMHNEYNSVAVERDFYKHKTEVLLNTVNTLLSNDSINTAIYSTPNDTVYSNEK